MSRSHILALLLGLLVVAAPFTRNTAMASEDEDDDDAEDVATITTKNFDSIVKGSKYALVSFTAPWCGHCKTLKPHWAKAATQIKAYDPTIVIANVDATQEGDLATKYEVKGYPTIKWFVNGELVSDYNGGRDTEGIVSWIKKKTGPWAVTADTADKLAALEKDNAVLFVAYVSAQEGKDFDTIKTVAEKTDGVAFAVTTSADVAKAAGLESAPALAVIKNFVGEEREVVPLGESISEDSVSTFVKAEKMPLTIEFNQGNSEKIFNSGIPKQIIYWSDANGLSAESEAFKALRTVAKAYKGKLVFVTANTDGDSHEPITNYFGLKGEASPVVLGFWMEKNRKYRLEGDVTTEALSAFAESIVDGSAQPQFKSAPIPEEPLDEGVTVVVGKNFEQVVLDPTKDVLLEVYAPWCGHCKKLAPIYSKLAKRFKTIDSVVIAKMDGTENEHSQVEAKGYPTLLFYPAGEDKTPITFEGGDRSLKALTKFIKEKAKIAYELPKKSAKEEAKEEGKDEL